jgi:hypothetical protein
MHLSPNPPPSRAGEATGTPAPAVSWKAVALPAEHGGWGFLVEPTVLGLVLAPSAAGICLAMAALAAFLARHPLRLALVDRRKGARYPRTAVAERFFLVDSVVALLMLASAAALAKGAFWPPLLAAAPAGLAALVFDARGRSREAFAETAGAVALGASAAAIALAGGVQPALAWGAWALLALRAAVSVLYVRARLRLDRGRDAGPGAALAGHAGAVAISLGLARSGAAPMLAVPAFLLLGARAAWGLSSRRRPVRPQALGFQEMGYGLLTLALLALGYRLGW